MQVIFQSENSECGLACLAMVASNFGLITDISSLRARYPVSLKGLNLQGITKVANELKLETRTLRCEVEELHDLKLPAILHWNMKHFVVLAKCKKDKYIIHDPAYGRITVSKDEMNKSFTGIATEAWPGPSFEKQDQRNKLNFRKVIPPIPGLKSALFSIFIYALGVELIILLLPIIQQVIIDDALVTADIDLLTLLIIATAVFLLGSTTASVIRRFIQRNLSSSLSMIVPSHVFRHLGSLPVSWFEKRSAADIVSRVESANTIHQTITTSVITAGLDGLVAILTFIAMCLYSFNLALIVLLSSGIYAAVRLSWYNSYRMKSYEMLTQKANLQGHMWETMRGMATIKLVNGFVNRENQYSSNLSKYVSLKMDITTADALFAFVHDLILLVERVGILYLGALAVLSADFTVGMLVAFLSFRDNFSRKTAKLIDIGIEFRMLGIHLDRLSDILLTDPEYKTELPFLGDREVSGEIEIRNISYRYGKNELDVLKNCSLQVAAGEIVAIIGPSGTGKSTLFKLLIGEFTPDNGDILIDGVSISSIGHERLRELVAAVRQDDLLFKGTISENIALMQETTDHQKVIDVSKIANIYDEIQKMPMGFNTLIGTMGTGLSGGQMQRIMLARALYREPNILVLDEATSSLDIENEKHISLALRGLGITQIIIAHRPETIAKADRVIDIRSISQGQSENIIPIKIKKQATEDNGL